MHVPIPSRSHQGCLPTQGMSSLTLSNLSPLILVPILRSPLPPLNSVCARLLHPSVLSFRLLYHRVSKYTNFNYTNVRPPPGFDTLRYMLSARALHILYQVYQRGTLYPLDHSIASLPVSPYPSDSSLSVSIVFNYCASLIRDYTDTVAW